MTAFIDRLYGVALVDAHNCNPNGNPDANNAPRVDVNDFGMMSAPCIKRKIRNHLETVRNLPLYHTAGVVLREQRQAATTKHKRPTYKNEDKGYTREDLRLNQMAICAEYVDARMFGAVMDLKEAKALNAAGPVWISPAETLDPVSINEMTITRQSIEAEDGKGNDRTMGTTFMIDYGLYMFEFEILPHFAARTGFTEEDADLFKEGLLHGFEDDQASNRKLDLRRVEVFRHKSNDGKPCLGYEPRHKLRDRVVVMRNPTVEIPKKYRDYTVSLNLNGLSAGITHESWV